jgi:predicted transcriptional regulator of viral defense system
MTYREFKETVQKWPIIFTKDVIALRHDKQLIRNQLNRWTAKRLLVKLKKGVYLLNKADRKAELPRQYIANQLYGPSYVSLEYALQYYGLIPERVGDVTSVTTRKTFRLTNEMGTFMYQHVKPEAFRGFKAVKGDAGLAFFIAKPEKALVDFIYLNIGKFKEGDEKVFEGSYRLQNLEDLDLDAIMECAKLFKSGKLVRISRALCGFIRKEKDR